MAGKQGGEGQPGTVPCRMGMFFFLLCVPCFVVLCFLFVPFFVVFVVLVSPFFLRVYVFVLGGRGGFIGDRWKFLSERRGGGGEGEAFLFVCVYMPLLLFVCFKVFCLCAFISVLFVCVYMLLLLCVVVVLGLFLAFDVCFFR